VNDFLTMWSGAARRFARSWWVVAVVWVVQLALAAAAGRWVGAAVSAGMRGYAIVDDGHLLFYVGSLLIEEPAVAVSILAALLSSATLGALGWVMLAGGIFRQLDVPGRGGDLLTDGLRLSPYMAAQTVWISLVRGLACLPFALPGAAGTVGAIIGGALLLLTVPVFDLARAEVSLTDPDNRPGRWRRLGPRPLLAAVTDTVQRPGYCLSSILAWLVGRGTVVAMLFIAVSVAPVDAGALWGLRALALVPLVAGVIRLALAVERFEA